MSASLQERIRRGLARQREAAEGEEPIPRRAAQGAARLSFAQQRIWFLQRLAPQASTYNIARAFEIDGRLDAAALERALVRLADRHEVLRTALHEVDGRGLQSIAAAVEAPLPHVDLSALGDAAPEAERLRLADLDRPFDVERAPLWRASLVVLAPRRHLLLLNLHHAIFDAWSMGILFDELSALYGEEAGGAAADLEELPIQYADYAEWQRERLDGERLDGLVDWWRRHLDGAPDVVELAADRPRPSFPSFRGDRSRQPLPADLTAAVRNPTQRGTTPFMVGLAAFVALVGRFTGGDDLVIGTPVAGRTHSRLEGLIGFFVSTLALRFDLSGDPTFEELLAQVRDTVLTAQDHAEVPFEVLVERLSPQRRLSHTPLFQALFTVRGAAPRFGLAGLEVTPIERRRVPAQFDLSMALVDEDDLLLAELTTSRDLFDRASGERLLSCYRTLLDAAVAEPERRLSELPLLDAGARHRVVEELNRTRRPYPREASLPELVSGFARRQPERVALTWIDGALADGAVRTMTYGELDAVSDRLARRLVASGVGRGDAVAVSVPRSPRMVAAILAVLKAGGFYVPLDAAYPVERLELMLRDSGAGHLVEVRSETPELPAGGLTRLDLGDEEGVEGEAGWLHADAPGVELPTIGADDLAYVMYTSGSTGIPKGVEIVHRNVVRLVCGDFADTGCDETWPHFAPAAFDASTIELWSPLANGGRLALAPPGPLSVDEMVTVIGRLGVTSAFLTAGLFHQMVENRLPALVGLRQLLSGGDVLSPSLVRQAVEGLPGTAVVNCYGPTENGVVSSRQRVNPDDLVGEVPIGEPIANSTAYVVDAALVPQPVGVPGELVVGGDGVGRGYRGRPALTARNFVPDPFGPPGSRLYRTGDQARWLSGGNLEFLGRHDDQVKIRGFRIELGEVRQALETLPGVAACTVVARAPEPSSGSRDKVLVGYVVAAGDATLDLDALRTLLARRLPAHLMPAHLVALDRLPLDAHGKVDRKKLPAPSAIDRHRDDDYVAPRGRIEEQVVEIWSDLLPEAGRIGVEDDFFHLGGHSLLANRVAARLRQVFGVELPLRTLFEAPTPAAVAGAVEMAIGEATPPPPPLTPADRSTPLPASFGQERLWFLAGLDPASTAYNVPCAWDLAGEVDETALAVALGDLVRRHESLRTRLVGAGGEGEAGPVQAIEPPAAEGEPFALERVDLSGLAGGERAAALDCASRAFARRRLDLATGPLFAAASFDLGRGQDGVRRRRLALLFHHAIFDGASLAVFERDLAVAYAARRRGVAPRLPVLAVQPADHAVWQRRRLGGGALDGQLDWWREQLAGVPALDLPTDRPRPPRRSGRGAVTRFVLPRRVSDAAGRAARELGGTRFMVLLAAFEALLGRHAGQSRFAVGVPVAGRQRSEVADLVGFFVNTLALPADVGGEPSFGALVERVRDGALAAFVRQEVPFAHLVADLAPRRRRDTTPLYQAMFSFDPANPRLDLTGAEVRRAGLDAGAARCDLTLLLREEPRGDGEEPLVAGLLEYDRDLFDAATVERFVGHYELLLAAACSHPEVPVEHLSFLTAGERAQVVHEFNDTATAYPRDASLAELVHWQAERRPAAVALAWDGAEAVETLSYARLAEASGRLARRLVAAGVRPGDGVALAAERSPELVVAILAVLEAGGFYVPLDPGYPPHRLAAMAGDTDCRLLLATPAVEPDLPPLPGVERLSLAGVAAADAPDAPDASTPRVDGDFYAYVMFTSGSTGRPKGVAVTHRNAVRLVQGSSFADLGPDATWLLFSTTAFDASTLELWAPLTHGGRLALAPPGRLSLADLAAAVGRFGVSHAWWTAGLFHQLIDEAPEALAPLRQVLAGGDVLSPEHVARLATARPDLAIVNGYGPTENTTFTTTARLDGLAARGGPLPIGRPIANTTTYVVDRHLRPQAVGVPGELVTGGDGVAVGYHGAAAATAERFVPDPFAAAPGARLYRTGDLVRWRLGGRLDFLGRIDRQVKIRGFRVEPGEVEALLATAPGVERCAVVARGDGDGGKRLVAYLVGDAAVEQLRGWLGERLPEHLRPAAFVALDELPLNANGKVDRGALPEPRPERREGEDYEAPRTATEEEVAAAWAKLLDADRVGRGDDFFSLGGHSLLATRAVSWLARRYGVELSLADFFDAPTVAEVAARVDDLAGGAAASGEALVPVDRRQPLPISYAQERLWFLDRLEPESTSYNVPFAWDVEGDLDAAALARAVGDLVRRHEALRTRFAVVGDGPESQQLVQVIDPPAAAGEPHPVERFDLSTLPHGERAAALERTSLAFARRHMDLAEGPLFHAFHADLGRGADGVRRHRFAALFHHVVADGWSLAVFERELTAAYAARLAGREPELPELPLQPADHAVWQRRRLDAGVADRELEWWRERLAGVPVLELPTDRPRPAQLLGRGAVHRFTLPAPAAEAAHAFARGAAASPFMVFLAAFEAVVARWAGQRRFAVGTPVAGRDRAEIEGLIGFFVNTLALPADLSGEPSFAELVGSVRATALAAYDRQQLPFSRLVERLAPQRRMSHTPFYQVMFTLQNTPPGDLALPGAEVRREPLDVGAARADLSLLLRRGGGSNEETDGALTGVVEYDRDLFDAATVERFCGHFATFLAAALERPETPFDRLPLMHAAEAKQVVEAFNETRVDYPRDASMVDLFRARADEQGARPALAWLDAAGEVARLSYADLDAASDHLARRLVAAGVVPADGVALAAARSPEMLLGLLAILKAGGHYVPLDPDYPAERLTFMATDSGCRLALVAPGAESALAGTDLPSLSLAGVLEPAYDDAATAAVRLPRPSAELPIYVMYTSGSTGRPKGVVVTHRNAVRLVQGATLTDFGPHATWLCNASTAFDASTLELWSPLAHGGCLAVVPPGLSLAELAAAVGRLGVTHAFFTCGLFSQMVDENVTALASVDHLFTGGDVAPVAAMRRVFEALPGTPVTNCYGPTENGTCTSTHRVAERDLDGAIPIGRPVENSTVYVVDRHLRPQPVGVAGELVTGDDGVAIGYRGRPALTAERFIPDPFASRPGSRLYVTGDLVRWRSDGLLDFMGRLDHQVKVRGFRIELGEVEATLSGAPGVTSCAVVVLGDPPAEKRLVAYVVAVGDEDAPALRSWLAERLPAFMLPTQWVFLDALPYNQNGKLDRKALPAPAAERAAAGEYRAPRNAVERELAELWARLLGVERVGVDDDFFELGGHSLLATRVVSWLGRRFGAELPLRTLFAAPTVAALTAEVAGAAVAAAPPKPLGRERPLPASYGQERLWFLERFEPGTTAYLIPGALRLRGHLDQRALESALTAVVARHEALRTRFVEIDGRPYQEAAPPPERFPLGFADLTALPEARREAAAEDLLAAERATPFDLGGGLLLRAVLLRLGDEEHVLSWVMHHLVSDGWSAGLLLRDLGAFYRAEVEGNEAELPELPVQYADFAAWQRDWLDSPAMELELGYWRQRLAGSGDGLDLPTDRPRPRVQGQRAGNLRRHLDPAVSKRVNDLARAAGATPFMVLLAAFDAVLSRLSGQTDLSVGTPIAGRSRSESEDLIGFFLNNLVLRLDLSGDPTFSELVARAKEAAGGAFAHQEVPFERLIQELEPERDPSRTPFFQVMLNLVPPVNELADFGGLTSERVLLPAAHSKFDLTLYVRTGDDGFGLGWVWNLDLFDAARIEEMAAQLEHVLAQACAAPELRLSELTLATPRATALPDPGRALPAVWDGPVHELVSRRAAAHPERPALADVEESWSYGELEARANRLANALVAAGVRRGDRVVIRGHRSAQIAVAVLGVMKSGGAFVVLDPAHPAPRRAFMVRHTQPQAMVVVAASGEVEPEVAEALAEVGCTAEFVLPSASLDAFTDTVPAVPLVPADACYVAFTSGSTGQPKGIVGTHGSLARYLPQVAAELGAGEERVSLLAGLSHDPLHRDLFVPLQLGGFLAIPEPERVAEPGWLAGWFADRRITWSHMTPGMSQLLTEPVERGEAGLLPELRRVIFYGDKVRRADVERLRALAPNVEAVLSYGSTETARAASYHRVDPAELAAGAIIPLGQGGPDSQLLVLDRCGRRAGIGELGEIWVRGPNMGRGYLVDAAATAERWRPHPGGGEAGERIYRTGDLGRHRPDGEVVFAGRADGQVKIRGFRVEPAEVEAVLAALPEVSKVAVVPFDDPALGTVLAAYVVTGEAAFDAAKLRRAVAEVVPEYMVPAAFTRLDELPLNANGKLDRKALPTPEPAAVVAAGGAGELPRSPLEELIVEVWRELLAAPDAGIHDDFFALGGHSLLATRAVSRLRQTAGVELPLAALFESPTPAALAERLEEELRGAAGVAMPPLERAEGDGPWPLSFSQQRQWFLEQIDPGSPAYLIPTVLAVSGAVDAGLLGDTLAALVARHEPLRTTFPLVDGEPVQKVDPVAGEVTRAAAELRFVDLAGLAPTERSAEAERLRHAEAHTVFDLSAGPLMRSLLVRLGDGEHRLHVTVHHIVTDGWSSAVLVRELVALYDAQAAGRPSPLEPLPVRYGDYTLWQHGWMSGEVLDRQLDWWKERLTDVPALELPTDRPRPAVQTHRGGRTGLDLGAESTAAMRGLARGHGATPFMVVTAAFEALLARLTGQRRFALGTFVANRHRAEIEPLVGFFVNSLALAADLEGEPSFGELLGRVRETTLGAYAHQDVPFERLLDELHPQRDLSRSPIFQAMVVGLAVGQGIDGEEGRHWQPLIRDSDRAAVDLTVWIYERGDDVRLELEYNRDLFDEATAATILGRLGRVLAAVSADASLTLGELPLMGDDERNRLLAAGNGDRLNNLSPAVPAVPVHLRVRAQAERTPEAVAVVAGSETLTYAELLGAARAVARRLAARGVGPDDLVAICLDRSPRLLVSMLGVHLAGAGYLPLDPAYPAERLAYLVEDSRTRLVLTDRRLAGELPVLSSAGAEVLAVDAADATAMGPEPLLAEELDAGAGLDRLAYVIYTSGSTGRPKGVAVPHRALAAFTAASAAATRVGPADRVLQFASPSFDTSAEEIWPTLAHGGTLVLREDTMLASAASFLGRCKELGITLLDLPTAFWHQVATAVGDGLELPASLTRVIIGGEAALAERLAEWHAGDGGGVELFNTYGPTETTVVATQWSIGGDAASALPDGRVPIGRPLPAVRAYALGAGFELVPEGATGELCLAGDHLARGYLGRPAATADAFRPDPHSAAPGGRLYRTGDLVRWRPDGHGLDYLGRRDDQVKVRGFRVELGEVEAAVSRHPGVRQAAVAAPRDASGVASLVAWVVADDGRLPDDLREALRRQLPDHMVPSVFVPLDAMPLNAHGKIDRAALPAPGAAAGSDHVPPSTAAEELLAEIWAEVLDVERIGADDDFFALGGHSLRATQVVTRLAREIDLELPVRQLFMTPTLRELARNVEDRLLAEEGLEGASDDTLEAS